VVTPKSGGILVLPYPQEVQFKGDTMVGSASIYVHQVTQSMNGPGNLVRVCREDVFTLCPGLAESWENNRDFTQWTFKIRNNVFWHDGTAFTAEDAKFWIDLAYAGVTKGEKNRLPSHYRIDLGAMEKTEVLDGNRLRVTLGRPEPNYLVPLARSEYNVAHPRHLMQPRIDQGDVLVAPEDVGWVSTGPFKFQSREKGSRFQVRRSDNFWQKDAQGRQLPFLDGIDFAFLSDASAIDAAIRVGRLDSGWRGPEYKLNQSRQSIFEKEMGDKIFFAIAPDFNIFFSFNILKPGSPLQDVRVRKAMSLWHDKQAGIQAVMDGHGSVPPLLAHGSPYTSPDFLTWPGINPATKERDRAEAKRLMAEAGYSAGFDTQEGCWRVMVPRCEFFQAQFKGLNLNLIATVLDTPVFFEARTRLGYDTYSGHLGWKTEFPIPEMLQLNLTTYSKSKISATKHEDAKIPEFFERIRGAATLEQRIKIHRELERYVFLEQVYLIPAFQLVFVVPVRSYVKGLVVPAANSNNNVEYATVWLDK
jgi:peptide/nickel transport system substrate-binding protein